MNQLKYLTAPSIAMVLPILFLGCAPHDAPPQASCDSMEVTATYDKGNGILLPQASIESLDISVGPPTRETFVSQRSFPSRLIKQTDSSGGVSYLVSTLVPSLDAPQAGTEVDLTPTTDGSKLRVTIGKIDRQLESLNQEVELITLLSEADVARIRASELKLSFQGSAPRSSMSIPPTALVRAALGDFAFVKTNDYFIRKPIVIGDVQQQQVEVLSGLNETDQVVITNAEKLWILELALVGGMSNLELSKEASSHD